MKKNYGLGRCIHAQLIETMQDIDGTFPDRGFKTRSLLAVLRSTIMPAVLVETAFIDNDIDALLLMNHQQEIAAAKPSKRLLFFAYLTQVIAHRNYSC